VATAAGPVITYAGTGTPGFANGAGAGVAAQFNLPQGLAISANFAYVYVADSNNFRVRSMKASNGYTTTAAGSAAIYQEGSGPSSQFILPAGIAAYAAAGAALGEDAPVTPTPPTPAAQPETAHSVYGIGLAVGVVADAEVGTAVSDPSPSPDDGHTGGVGTATYAAPEQSSGRGYGPPADVYSLGLILLELLCRFGTGMERARAMAAARAGALPREALERGAPGAAALVAAMLSPDPALRPTAAAVARSPALRRAGGDQAGGDVAALRAALAAKEAELGRLRAALERATVAAA
jgi:hypothetical protein